MDTETREALEGSIRKWEGVASGKKGERGTSDCPLCNKFFHQAEGGYCVRCPVYARTGRPGCMESPWTNWIAASGWSAELGRCADTDAGRNAARAELDFLISLIPKKDAKS